MIRVVEYKIKNELDFNNMIQNAKNERFRCIETGEIKFSDQMTYDVNKKTFHKMVNFNDR